MAFKDFFSVLAQVTLFVLQCGTVMAIFAGGLYGKHLREIILNLGSAGQEAMSIKYFSTFTSGGHFVRRREPVWAILEEGLMRNTCV